MTTPIYKAGPQLETALSTWGVTTTAALAAKRISDRYKAIMNKRAQAEADRQTLRRDAAGYIQRVRASRKDKKKVTRRSAALKMLTKGCVNLITRFQNLSNVGASLMPQYLNYQTGSSPGISVYPFYCFDLTGLANRTGPSNNFYRCPNVLYRLKRSRNDAVATEVANKFYWDPVAAAAADGTLTTNTWLVERRPAHMQPNAKALLEWVEMKIGVVGPKSYPCKVVCQLVQFDERFVPGHYETSVNSGQIDTNQYMNPGTKAEKDPADNGDEERTRVWNEFYIGLTDTSVSHPFNKRDAYNVKGLKVLSSQVMEFNPTSNYETDPRGHKKEFVWRKQFNRVCNYQWENNYKLTFVEADTTPQAVPVVNEGNSNVWDTANPNPCRVSTDDSIQSCVHPKARIFLLIYAESPVNGAAAEANHAGFEFQIRRSHMYAQSA